MDKADGERNPMMDNSTPLRKKDLKDPKIVAGVEQIKEQGADAAEHPDYSEEAQDEEGNAKGTQGTSN